MIDAARQISLEPRHWWFDQLNNADAMLGYHWERKSGGNPTVDRHELSSILGTAMSYDVAASIRQA